MSAWFFLVLALLHAGAAVSLIAEAKYALAAVMVGGMIVQIGLLMSARG